VGTEESVMSAKTNHSDVGEVSPVGQGETDESTAAKRAALEAEGEVAEAACVGRERASGDVAVDNGAVGDGSEQTSSPGGRRQGLREVCLAVVKRFEAGKADQGAATDRRAGEVPAEAAREDASEPSIVDVASEAPVLRLPDEDVCVGGTGEEFTDRGGPRGVLRKVSSNPAAVAIGVAALGGVSIIVLSVVLGASGSAPSGAMPKVDGLSSVARGPADPGLMAPSAKLATVGLPEPQGPVVKPQPEKKAGDELREEVLSFGEGSRKAEARVAATSKKGEPKLVVLEPGLTEPGVERASGSSEKGTPSGRTGAKTEGGLAAGQDVSGRSEARAGQGQDQVVQSVEVSGSGHSEETSREAGAGGDGPGSRVAVARPEDRGRSGETQEVKSPALGQERSGDGSDKVAKEALGLVTQLGALLAEAREELAALKIDHARLRGMAEGRLGELDTRVGFLEAKSAVAEARLAGKPSDAVATSPVPNAVPRQDPARADVPIDGAGEARIIKARAVEGGSLRETGGLRRYRVQAASPNLAMLAEIDRSGDVGAQIEVALGDKVAGYGRVTKIVQRGTAWVVQTEKGTID
jgi:hypothetical protein